MVNLSDQKLPYSFSVMAKDAGDVHKLLQKNGIYINRHPQGKINVSTSLILQSKVNDKYEPSFDPNNDNDVLLERVYRISLLKHQYKQFFSVETCEKITGIPKKDIENILLKYF